MEKERTPNVRSSWHGVMSSCPHHIWNSFIPFSWYLFWYVLLTLINPVDGWVHPLRMEPFLKFNNTKSSCSTHVTHYIKLTYCINSKKVEAKGSPAPPKRMNFRKAPNDLWPPPHFRKIILQCFPKFMTEVSIMAKICDIIFWIENDPAPLFGTFPKLRFGGFPNTSKIQIGCFRDLCSLSLTPVD